MIVLATAHWSGASSSHEPPVCVVSAILQTVGTKPTSASPACSRKAPVKVDKSTFASWTLQSQNLLNNPFAKKLHSFVSPYIHLRYLLFHLTYFDVVLLGLLPQCVAYRNLLSCFQINVKGLLIEVLHHLRDFEKRDYRFRYALATADPQFIPPEGSNFVQRTGFLDNFTETCRSRHVK